MSFILGLTGSIGMGKSTTSQMFHDLGCDIWDADKAVKDLYSLGGKAVAVFEKARPDVVVDGAVSKKQLKDWIAKDRTALNRIEKIVHPLVAQHRQDFIFASTADIIVLEIPLLFETGVFEHMDAIACVTLDPAVQRKRVLDRGTMTEREFEQILDRQMPDAQKRKKSDYIIETDTLDHALAQVQSIVLDIKAKINA